MKHHSKSHNSSRVALFQERAKISSIVKKVRLLACPMMAMMICMMSFALPIVGQNGGHQRPGGFKPHLDGVWQMCQLSEGEDGRPLLKFMPILRVYGTDGKYQTIALPDDGGCFITEEGTIEKTSDSTYTAVPLSFKIDSVRPEALSVGYKFRGPVWLTLKYKSAGEEESKVELWMRVRQKTKMNKQDGVRGGRNHNTQGPQRKMGKIKSQLQKNPFEESSESNSMSDADD